MTLVQPLDNVALATDLDAPPVYPFSMALPTADVDAGARTTWITPREAAAYLGVCVESIYDACAAGGLKHSRLGRRTIRLRREWLDAWAEEHVRQAK